MPPEADLQKADLIKKAIAVASRSLRTMTDGGKK